MPAPLEYLRPQTLDEALTLLRRPGRRTVPLAGGAWLTPRLRRDVDVPQPLAEPVDAVVDLADLGLDGIDLEGEPGAGWLVLGATTTLAQIADSALCREVAGGILAQAAQREAPVNQRNVATVAGAALAASSQSELLLALLALAGHAAIAADQPRVLPLNELLADPGQLAGGLVTALRLPWPAATVRGGLARVARTPGDAPIVAAVAVVDDAGRRLAVGGVAAGPLLLRLGADDDLEAALNAALAGVDLLSDWQGSSEYRRAMAAVLSRRALDQAAS
ncbi:MAG: FAD binding domain-containing protein [Anaerolinea sp.]|nr:FAD binding domain-containing protein [Anaerolinea sp.]